MLMKGMYSVIFIVLIVLMAILIVFSLDTRSTSNYVNGVPVSSVLSLQSGSHDAVILVTYPPTAAVQPVPALQNILESARELDSALAGSPAVLITPWVSGSRLVVSPTGPLTPYHDVTSIYNAARAGMVRAMSAGARRPILVVQSNPDFPDADLATLMGAFETLYTPIEIREWFPERGPKLDSLGVYGDGLTRYLDALIRNAVALEQARAVTRDIAAGDPERMTPKMVEAYVRDEVASSPQVTMNVIDDEETIRREYPLFWPVTRAANTVDRHKGNIITLEYNPPTGEPEETVILVGKGITYDSGGISLKSNAGMLSMSRDKSGAAAVAGFIKACDLMRPQIKVIGVMCMARNSIGEEAYVPDELIVSRSGKTVRISNADAEGRLVMADMLYEMKIRAKDEVNPHIYTMATLTGHARTHAGTGFFIAMDNHVARESNHAYQFQESANSVGDMAEVSVIRREDLADFRGRAEGDDIYQTNNRGIGERGHQGPGAFMLLVSDLHEGDIPYTHLDVAPSTGSLPARATASPLLALAKHHRLMQY